MKFNDYSIVSTLYESELSLIFKAVRNNDQMPVVIKMLNTEYPSSEQTDKYIYEYRLMNGIESSGTVKAYDLLNYEHTMAIVLEDFGATPLKAIDFENIPLIERLELFVDVAKILDDIHRENILHKDINPSNILWNQITNVVKISDFGIARKLSAEESTAKEVEFLEGTLAYISPEQTGRMNRSLDYRGDYYSLGATFYEVLAGQPLYMHIDDPMEMVHSHIAVVPKQLYHVNPSIPIVLSDIVMKLLSKEPEQRYQSMQGLIFDLNHCIDQLETQHVIKPFEIASKDFSATFRIPEKLYGRENDLDELKECYKLICDGHKEWLLVSGYSGVGKSALIHAFEQSIIQNNGLYLEGKYDKYKRDVPHSAIIETLKQLATLMVAASEETKEEWKVRLQDEVGTLAAIIVEIIPEMKLVFGEREVLETLPPREERQRLLNAFVGLLKAVASHHSPLVMFLDDLQWSDTASLEFIEEVLKSDISNLLIIGAYRENEVDETHPLKIMTQKMDAAGKRPKLLQVKPLKRQFINALISDSMGCDYQESEALTEFIMQKTQGNPFFTKHLLTHLHNEKAIKYDVDLHKWTFSSESLKGTQYLTQVAELISARIDRLPQESKDLLKYAAVLGNPFDLVLLSVITKRTKDETLRILDPLLKDELVFVREYTTDNTVSYHFIHDQVQQSAYELCTNKAEVHAQIGLMLLEKSKAENSDFNVYMVVDHLNKGLGYINDVTIQAKMIELNLAASKQAKKTAAFRAAYDYVQRCILLFGKNLWTVQHELAVDVYKTAAEVAYLTGAYQEMEVFCHDVLQQSDRIEDRNVIYQIRIGAAIAQNDPDGSIDIAVEALKNLGLDLPRHPNRLTLLKYLGRVQLKLRSFDESSILALKPMTNQTVLAQMDILSSVASAAYLAAQELFLIICLIQVELSLKHGRTDMLANAFSLYSMILAGALHQYEKAYAYGEIALKLADLEQDKRLHAKVHFHLCNFNFHWKESKQLVMDRYMTAYNLGVINGDTEYAAWSLFFYATYVFYKGGNLKELQKIFESSGKNILQLNQAKQWNYNQLHLEMINALLSDEFVEMNDQYEEHLTDLKARNDTSGLFYMAYCRGVYALYAADAREAVSQFKNALPHLDGVISTNSYALFFYYYGMSQLRLLKTASTGKYSVKLKSVRSCLQKLKKWSQLNPESYEHCFQLLVAEFNRVTGDLEQAEKAYDLAIELTGTINCLQDEALACELASEYYQWKKRRFIAKNYSAKAAYLYEKWGAKAKANHLKQQDTSLLVSASRTYKRDLSKSTTGKRITQSLDLESIIKGSQMLSKEIEVEKLLKRFMKLIIENAGAQEGMILLQSNEGLQVEVQWDPHEKDVLTSEQHKVFYGFHEAWEGLPKSLVQYVIQLKRSVIIDDASQDELVKEDSYIVHKKAKSILCIPVIIKGNLGGVLYLENNASTHAFREEHVETLQMMSTQASISLENAKLYEHLEDKVRERTEELKELTEKYQMLSVTDQLTGLFNRRKLDEVLLYEFKKIQRYDHILAMILLDIDHFKSINDTYGHPVGDQVLITLSDLLKNNVRKTDTVGRWGGEEFMVICPDTSVNEAETLAEHLRERIESAEMPFDRNVTSSFGVSDSTDKLTVEQMVHYADEGLYEAKASGRNKVISK